MFIIKSFIIYGFLNLLYGLFWYDCSVFIDLIVCIKIFKLIKKFIKDWYFNNYIYFKLFYVLELRIVVLIFLFIGFFYWCLKIFCVSVIFIGLELL